MEGGVEPGGGKAGGGCEEGREFGGVEAAVIVGIGEEEEIDKETVAGRGELGGGVRGNFEFRVEEGVAEGKGVGVVEGTEDDPDGFVAALFGEELVEEDEAGLADTCFGYRVGGVFADSFFDVLKVVLCEGFAEAFDLEILHFFVTQVAIMISIGKVEYPLQRCDTSRLQVGLL